MTISRRTAAADAPGGSASRDEKAEAGRNDIKASLPPSKWFRRRGPWIALVSAAVAVSFAIAAIHASEAPATAPSCAWAKASIDGGTSSQRGVVRCYLSALASKNESAMTAVVNENQGDKPKPRAFKFWRSAARGVTHVSFKHNDVDLADLEVDLVFADGHKDVQEVHIADPMSSTDWRFSDVNDHSTQSYTN
jgi:hypothetical protein